MELYGRREGEEGYPLSSLVNTGIFEILTFL